MPYSAQLCQDSGVPKIVDHENRRAEIARALWRVIARDGMQAASARTVAAEAGWSLGAVRHYFSSQDELLRFAAQAMLASGVERILEVLRANPPGLDRAALILEQLLPLDERRTGECRVFLATLVRAQADPALDGIRLTAWEGERRICRAVIADLTGRQIVDLEAMAGDEQTGSIDTTVPLHPTQEAEAALLHTLVDGLTLQATTTPERYPNDQLRAVVRHHLQQAAARLTRQ